MFDEQFEDDKQGKQRCEKCEYKHIVHADGGFMFNGCYHRPYIGKWVAEIKDCPKEGKYKDTVHCLSSLPANDVNFLSELNRATDDEISQAIDVMEDSSGQHKGRITACQRELRKRMKVRNNQ